MARDHSLDDLHGVVSGGSGPRLPLTVLLVFLALVVLGLGAGLVLVVVNNDKEGENLNEADSPGVVCRHLYNEIPMDATEFDPDLNAEYRSCVRRESYKKHAAVSVPFLLPAIGLLATAVWVSIRRRPTRLPPERP